MAENNDLMKIAISLFLIVLCMNTIWGFYNLALSKKNINNTAYAIAANDVFTQTMGDAQSIINNANTTQLGCPTGSTNISCQGDIRATSPYGGNIVDDLFTLGLNVLKFLLFVIEIIGMILLAGFILFIRITSVTSNPFLALLAGLFALFVQWITFWLVFRLFIIKKT